MARQGVQCRCSQQMWGRGPGNGAQKRERVRERRIQCWEFLRDWRQKEGNKLVDLGKCGGVYRKSRL